MINQIIKISQEFLESETQEEKLLSGLDLIMDLCVNLKEIDFVCIDLLKIISNINVNCKQTILNFYLSKIINQLKSECQKVFIGFIKLFELV